MPFSKLLFFTILLHLLSLAFQFSLDGRISPMNDNPSVGHAFSGISKDSFVDDDEDISSGHFEPLKVLCEINGYIIPAIIDTGAQISIMSESCAKRCRISNIDERFAGRAIGVGTSEILGRVNNLPMRIGPINFEGRVSILRGSRIDFLIGLDFLRRFNCEVSLRDNSLRMSLRNRVFKVPFEKDKNFEICVDDDINTLVHDTRDKNYEYESAEASEADHAPNNDMSFGKRKAIEISRGLSRADEKHFADEDMDDSNDDSFYNDNDEDDDLENPIEPVKTSTMVHRSRPRLSMEGV